MIPIDAIRDLDKATLIELVLKLSSEIDGLKARLDKHSGNSSKPPSSDGFRKAPKPKSLRGKSGKKSGGQPGHPGETLKAVLHPDRQIVHVVTHCDGCGIELSEVVSGLGEKRQIFDIPLPKLEVVEHVSAVVCCPGCSKVSRGKFPEGVTASVQYGPRVQATAIYLLYQQLIPERRVAESFADLYGITICGASLSNSGKKLYGNLDGYEQSAEQFLAAGTLTHFDETGMRVGKSLSWLHSASNTQATLYKIHKKRGFEAMESFYVHQHFEGIAIHDCWKPYFKLKAKKHALCNAHIVRELVGLYEQIAAPWVQAMERFLLKAHRYASVFRAEGGLPLTYRAKLETEYDEILQEAACHYNEVSRKTKPPGEALFRRLSDYKTEILRFIHDVEVPFSNNQAEQDIRMCKVRQKVSGCFRSETGADIFCRIRGYLSTARKQRYNIFNAILDALNGNPLTLKA